MVFKVIAYRYLYSMTSSTKFRTPVLMSASQIRHENIITCIESYFFINFRKRNATFVFSFFHYEPFIDVPAPM